MCVHVLCPVAASFVFNVQHVGDNCRHLLYYCATQRSSTPSISDFTVILKSDQDNVGKCSCEVALLGKKNIL